ncbi:bola-like protein [Westerdykella ornata]|uniref:Bola-like protein n=1 Tax=Westerdykella ornata TaxID=318751 RepID=A0A6A6JNR4_WESOR|nr:bola-like protein [Westerdykella ornata]KAF2277783.1 bola-like protein [Westerdykella ornata]
MAPSRALLPLRSATPFQRRGPPHLHLLPSTPSRIRNICCNRYPAASLAAIHTDSRLFSPNRFNDSGRRQQRQLLLRGSGTTAPFFLTRPYSQPATAPEPPDYLNDAERHIFDKIKAELEPVKLEVQDISGGCGSMYALEIESPKFKGLSVVKQHKLVNSVLAEEIKGWHGVQLRTRPSA